ncbi:MAG: gamma-glutamylcyclotransferase [Sandaracinaceae bacterium]|nr:gamma-glutamylcyclotransferase [Sandaracinaceae bacterium]
MRYFAYGSNLHLDDLSRFCRERGYDAGAIRPLGPAWLPDHEPVYHYRSIARRGGALSVREAFGRATPGLLFEVDGAGWRALDAKEGARYARVERVVLFDGSEQRAATYVVREAHREAAHVAPREDYAALVEAGLAAHGLPTAQARDAARGLDVAPLPRALFVYGTLMRGEVRAPILARHAASFCGPAEVRGALVDLGAYPGLIEGDGVVRGELVELTEPADALAELDDVEGFLGYGRAGSLYRRVVIRAGDTYAWTYRYAGPGGAPRIASGDWRRRGAGC